MNRPDLCQLVAQAPVEELPRLLGDLVEAEERLRLRLRSAPSPVAVPPATAEEGRMLTPGEAAEIARVPVARVYQWARGQRWSSRPTRRCLRISELGFRRWLARRA